MAKIFILRHGPAAHNLGDNVKHTFAGNAIDNSLSKQGIELAKNLGTAIKSQNSCDIVLASKLKRSIETAKIIADINECQVEVIDNLEEINIGDFAGHTEEEVRELYPKEAKAFYDGELPKWSFPNGENFEEAEFRGSLALDAIYNYAKKYNTIVVVGHGMMNRILFHKIMPEKVELWQERAYPHDRIVEIERNC